LADELSNVQYQHLAEVQGRLSNLEDTWSSLQATADSRKAGLHAQLQRLQAIENAQLEFAKKALHLRVWLDRAEETLTDPIWVDTVEAIEELQASFETFVQDAGEKTAEFDTLGQLAENCRAEGAAEDAFSEVSWARLSELWAKNAGQVETRRAELAQEADRQRHNDALRKHFAEKAKEFNQWLESQQQTVDTLSGPGEEQVEKLKHLEHQIAADGNPRFNFVEEATKKLDEANVDDNPYTELTYDGLKKALENLSVLVKKKRQAVEKELLAQTHSGVSAEQLKEFKDCFSHFDKDGDQHLDRLEFGACLKSLGEDIPFESGGKLDQVLKTIDEDGDGKVTFDEFLHYMTSLSSDSDTPANLIGAFRTLAGEKDYVTLSELTAVLPPEKVEYLLAHMPPYPGVDNAYDYKAFTGFAYGQ